MALVHTCEVCGSKSEVSQNDELPALLVKIIRVERQHNACGATVTGLETPNTCPNEDCPDPDRPWGPAERVVSEAVELSVCTDCQDEHDTAAELRAALSDSDGDD